MKHAQHVEVWKKVDGAHVSTDDGWVEINAGTHLVRVRLPPGGNLGKNENPVHFGKITYEDESQVVKKEIMRENLTAPETEAWELAPAEGMMVQNVVATKVTLQGGQQIEGIPLRESIQPGTYVSEAVPVPGQPGALQNIVVPGGPPGT